MKSYAERHFSRETMRAALLAALAGERRPISMPPSASSAPPNSIRNRNEPDISVEFREAPDRHNTGLGVYFQLGHSLGQYQMTSRSWEQKWDFAVLAGLTLAFCTLAVHRGPDGNWDMLNYHLYNPFALLNGKIGYDIAAAQVQTYINPELDLLYYIVFKLLNNQPNLFLCVLAVPQIIVGFLSYRIALRVLPSATEWREVLASLAVILDMTGSAALPTLSTTQSEMVPAAFLLGSLLIAVRSLAPRPGMIAHFGVAGLLAGMAGGLKLTLAPYDVAMAIAILLSSGFPVRVRIKTLATFCGGGLAGAMISNGPWWIIMYMHYDSPMFPFFNDIFNSPFYPPVRFVDSRWYPRDWLHGIFFPFYWARNVQRLVAEIPFRDPRFALTYAATLSIGARALLTRIRGTNPSDTPLGREACFVLVFLVAGFALWEATFSILRYLAPLEPLVGIPILVALYYGIRANRIRYAPHAGLAVVVVLAMMMTVYPEWGHARPIQSAVRVIPPAMPTDTLVILLDPNPMAFVAVFVSPRIRFVGANNNLVGPGHASRLQAEIEAVIRGHDGPIWGLEGLKEEPGKADSTLAYYGLRRGPGCRPVEANLNRDTTMACPLVRETRRQTRGTP